MRMSVLISSVNRDVLLEIICKLDSTERAHKALGALWRLMPRVGSHSKCSRRLLCATVESALLYGVSMECGHTAEANDCTTKSC